MLAPMDFDRSVARPRKARLVLLGLVVALALWGCQGFGARPATPSPTAFAATAIASAPSTPPSEAEVLPQTLPRVQGAVDDPAALQAALQALLAYARQVWVAQVPPTVPHLPPWPAETRWVLALTLGPGEGLHATQGVSWVFYLESPRPVAAWRAALEANLTEAGWFAQPVTQTLWCHPAGQWGLEADVRALEDERTVTRVTLTPQPRWCAPEPPGQPAPQWLPPLSVAAGTRTLNLTATTGPQGEVYGGFVITPRALEDLAQASASAMRARGWQAQGCEGWPLVDRAGTAHEGVHLCRWQREAEQGPSRAVQVWVRLIPYNARAVYALQAALSPFRPTPATLWPRLVVPPQPVEPLRRALALVALFAHSPIAGPGTVWVGEPPRPWPERLPRLEVAAWVVTQQTSDALIVHTHWPTEPEQALAQARALLEQAGWYTVPHFTRGFTVVPVETWMACHPRRAGWWRVWARPAPQGEGAWVTLTWSADAPRGCAVPTPSLPPALEALPRLELPAGAQVYWESQVALEPAARAHFEAAVWASTLPWAQEQAALTEALGAQGWTPGPVQERADGSAMWWQPPSGAESPAVHLLLLNLGAGWRFGLMGAGPSDAEP